MDEDARVEQKRRYLAAVAADTYMDETGRLKPTKPEPPKQGRSADDGNPNDGSSSGSTKLLAAAAGAARRRGPRSSAIVVARLSKHAARRQLLCLGHGYISLPESSTPWDRYLKVPE